MSNSFDRRREEKIISRPKSPIHMEMNWYTEDAMWRYAFKGDGTPQSEYNLKHRTGNARNLKGVILEPGLAKIEGQNKEGTWKISSNLTMSTVMEVFHITRYRRGEGRESESLGIGEWTGALKEKVTSNQHQGKWHKTVAIYLLEVEVQQYNPDTGKSLKGWKKIKPNCIVLLKLRGWGNKLGWVASCEESGHDPMNITGVVFSHTENYKQPKGTVKIQKTDWFYPAFSFTEFSDLPKKVSAFVLEKAEPAMEEFQSYLRDHLNYFEEKALSGDQYEAPQAGVDEDESENEIPEQFKTTEEKKATSRRRRSKTEQALDDASDRKRGKGAVTEVMTEEEPEEDVFSGDDDLPF